MIRHQPCPIVFSTHGPGHHFFGYYDKSPIDRDGKRMLSHRAMFDWKRDPHPDDVVDIGYWDLKTETYQVVAQSRTYNWQQGSQLQWLPPDYNRRIIFNDREGDQFVSRIIDLENGQVRTLPLPISTLHPSGKTAICVNYKRLAFTHPGYHYEGITDPRWSGSLPEGDGLFRLDLESGDCRLAVSTSDLVTLNPLSTMNGAMHYLEHAMFSPSGRRFAFMHRWRLPDGGNHTRLLTAKPDGTDVRCVLDSGNVSHVGWRGDDQIVAWGRSPSVLTSIRKSRTLGRLLLKPLLPIYHKLQARAGLAPHRMAGDTYLLLGADEGGSYEPLAPGVAFPGDGHCTFKSGDPRWMLTDTYQDEHFHRHLFLFDADQKELIEIGTFFSVPESCSTGFRCDLHPRWDFEGQRVCMDSTHLNGERQMYVIDASKVIADRTVL